MANISIGKTKSKKIFYLFFILLFLNESIVAQGYFNVKKERRGIYSYCSYFYSKGVNSFFDYSNFAYVDSGNVLVQVFSKSIIQIMNPGDYSFSVEFFSAKQDTNLFTNRYFYLNLDIPDSFLVGEKFLLYEKEKKEMVDFLDSFKMKVKGKKATIKFGKLLSKKKIEIPLSDFKVGSLEILADEIRKYACKRNMDFIFEIGFGKAGAGK